jgi:FMN phosphatase YigB (HAD superfamily)
MTTVISDIGDVLIRTVPHAHHRWLARRTGRSWPEVAGQIEASGAEPAFERGEVSPAEFAELVRRAVGHPGLTGEDVGTAWAQVIAGPEPATVAAARGLARAGRLVLASNTNAWHWPKVRQILFAAGLRAPAWLSFRVGRVKPDPEFFAGLLAGLDANRVDRTGTCVFIDDRPDNVGAANAAGLSGRLHRDAADTAAYLGELLRRPGLFRGLFRPDLDDAVAGVSLASSSHGKGRPCRQWSSISGPTTTPECPGTG